MLQPNTAKLNRELTKVALAKASQDPLAGTGNRAEHLTPSIVGGFFTQRSQKLSSYEAKVKKYAKYPGEGTCMLQTRSLGSSLTLAPLTR